MTTTEPPDPRPRPMSLGEQFSAAAAAAELRRIPAARVPPTSVDIERSGRWSWYGHMRAGFANVSPPLFAFTERGIRRKARRWIARTEQTKHREHFTITADDLRSEA